MVIGFGKCTGSQSHTVADPSLHIPMHNFMWLTKPARPLQYFFTRIMMAWGDLLTACNSAKERLFFEEPFPQASLKLYRRYLPYLEIVTINCEFLNIVSKGPGAEWN